MIARIATAFAAALAATVLYVPAASAKCYECGTIAEIRQIEKKGESSGGGAVIGGVLGAVLDGKTGAVIGAIVGGGGAVVASSGEEVELPAGTVLTVQLERPMTLARR